MAALTRQPRAAARMTWATPGSARPRLSRHTDNPEARPTPYLPLGEVRSRPAVPWWARRSGLPGHGTTSRRQEILDPHLPCQVCPPGTAHHAPFHRFEAPSTTLNPYRVPSRPAARCRRRTGHLRHPRLKATYGKAAWAATTQSRGKCRRCPNLRAGESRQLTSTSRPQRRLSPSLPCRSPQRGVVAAGGHPHLQCIAV
jgi:hypothetical protein